jgi:hypothetical protein
LGLTPAFATATTEAGIAEQAQGGLQTRTPDLFAGRIFETGDGPQACAWFKLDTRHGVAFVPGICDAINGGCAACDCAERTGTGTITAEKTAAFRIWQPLIGKNGLAGNERIDDAERNEAGSFPADFCEEDGAWRIQQARRRRPQRGWRNGVERIALKWIERAEDDRRFGGVRSSSEPLVKETQALHGERDGGVEAVTAIERIYAIVSSLRWSVAPRAQRTEPYQKPWLHVRLTSR